MKTRIFNKKGLQKLLLVCLPLCMLATSRPALAETRAREIKYHNQNQYSDSYDYQPAQVARADVADPNPADPNAQMQDFNTPPKTPPYGSGNVDITGEYYYEEFSDAWHPPRHVNELTPAQWKTVMLFHRVNFLFTAEEQRILTDYLTHY